MTFAADIDTDNANLAVDEDIENLAIDETDVSQQSDDSQDVVKASENTVTPENINDFVDDETKTITYEGEELIFVGEFNSSVINGINIAAPIKLTGNDATMKNVSFYVMSSEVVIKGFTFIQDNYDVSQITIIDSENVEISDVNIAFTANQKYEGYAIQANNATNLKLINNNINFAGNTVYNGPDTIIINAVFVSGSDDVVVRGNRFKVNITSCTVDWPEIPAGSWNYIRVPYSEGIVFDGCDDLEFVDNDISLVYGSRSGSQDSIYVLDVKNSDNAMISGNSFDVLGADHVYGIIVDNTGNFTISDNDLSISSDVHQAVGIDVEGPATGVIKDNNISAYGTLVNSIYSGMNWKPATVEIENNNITADGYEAIALELGGTSATVKGNTIVAKGNYTAGIISDIPNLIVSGNNISSYGSNIGETKGDYYMDKDVMGIKIYSGVANILDNEINSGNVGVRANSGTDITLNNNQINVESKMENVTGYAIEVNSAKLNMVNNNVTFEGKTVYSTEDDIAVINAVFVSGSDDVVVRGNRFKLNISSCAVDWHEIPAGSWNYIRVPYSEGIVFDGCDDLEFVDNDINLVYGSRSGYDDTIYVLDVKNSDNAMISGNSFDVLGADHVYGIIVDNDDNFTIEGNDLSISSDVHQAVGIDVEGPTMGIIKENNISANGNLVNSIYSGMNGKPATVEIKNNNISANGYAANALEIGGTSSAIIKGNNIISNGNYSSGIVSMVPDLTVSGNDITVIGSNIGENSIGDYYLDKEVIGIKITSGDSSIVNNKILTNGNNTIKFGDTVAVIKNNSLKANNSEGIDSIETAGQVYNLDDSTSLKTVLVGSDVNKIYGDGTQYILNVLDENGNPIIGKIVTAVIGTQSYEVTTDEKGVAKFDIDLTVGNYTIEASFSGSSLYSAKSTSNTITVTAKPTKITAPNASVLVTAAKKGYNYKITLKDNSGNILANKKITINGKEYTTDKNGVVTYKLSASKQGSQKLTVKFDGDDKYAASTATATVKFTKEATKLTAKKATLKKKSKKYSVSLKDSTGKGIKGVKVTIKVGKKTYTATTKANGKATFNLKKLTKKGKYTAKVTFKTTALYKAASATAKITVKK